MDAVIEYDSDQIMCGEKMPQPELTRNWKMKPSDIQPILD